MGDLRDVIDIVVPAHNEGSAIGTTLREFHAVVARSGIRVRFVVCEDGSTDDTVEVVEDVGRELPVLLLSSQERKGYSRAVVDGLKATTSELVSFIDSDGQCDPADFAPMVELARTCDMVIGYRQPRMDKLHRRVLSRSFKLVYERAFPVRLRDPSCPFLVIHRSALTRVLRGDPGLFPQGFWWEFNARAQSAGLHVLEVPVRHRERIAGVTQVYHPSRFLRIGVDHLRAMRALRRELRALES